MCPRLSLPCVVSLYRDPRSFHQEGISAQCTRGTIHEPAQSLNRRWQVWFSQVWFWQVWRSLVKIDHETSELNPSLCDDSAIFCQTPRKAFTHCARWRTNRSRVRKTVTAACALSLLPVPVAQRFLRIHSASLDAMQRQQSPLHRFFDASQTG